MALPPDQTKDAAPEGLTDYIVRFRCRGRDVRSQVFRAATESAAVQLVQDAAAPGGRWAGWSILDMLTVDEAMARRGGLS